MPVDNSNLKSFHKLSDFVLSSMSVWSNQDVIAKGFAEE